MKILTFAALAATLALSSLAHATNPGRNLNRFFGTETEGFVGDQGFDAEGGAPPPPPAIAGPAALNLPLPERCKYVRPEHRPGVTTFDEGLCLQDIQAIIPPGGPTKCIVRPITGVRAEILIKTPNRGPVYLWDGFGRGQEDIDRRLQQALIPNGYCTDGVIISKIPVTGGY